MTLQERDEQRILIDCYRVEVEKYHNGERATHPRDEYLNHLAELSLVSRLWASSTGLLDRFNAQPSIKQASDRMMSEVLELVIAAHDTHGASTRDIAEEAADVVVTAINVLRAACVTEEQFAEALESIIRKNDKKNHESHQLNVQTQGVERIGKTVKS